MALTYISGDGVVNMANANTLYTILQPAAGEEWNITIALITSNTYLQVGGSTTCRSALVASSYQGKFLLSNASPLKAWNSSNNAPVTYNYWGYKKT